MRSRVVLNRLGALALAGWFIAMAVLGAGLLARHVLALPGPAQDEKLGLSFRKFRGAAGGGAWLAVHVLDAECRCSQRIATHLLSTPRPAGWEELVLWVGNGAPSAELERRFSVRRLARLELSQLGIEAAPLLIVVDAEDNVRYSGGYGDRKQGPVIDDLDILQATRVGGRIASLPVFGCAVSDRLKREFERLPTL